VDKVITVSLFALAGAGVLTFMAVPSAKADTMPIAATGKKLSFVDLLALAQDAGFEGQDSVIAAGIALAESRGDPMAIGDQGLAPENGPSYGLWQINVGRKAHPEYAGVNLYDPATNAAKAFEVYDRAGASFRPWTTYTSQAYYRNIPAGFLV